MTNTDVQAQVRRLAELKDCPNWHLHQYMIGMPEGGGEPDGAICADCKDGQPLIRTADGRTLRRECNEAIRDDEGFPMGHCSTGFPRMKSCPLCHGTGWLPVEPDTAQAVVTQWAHEQGISVWFPGEGESVDQVELEWAAQSIVKYATIHDHNVQAALFDAVEAAIGKGL
jgi:hypothetical protein